LLIHCLFIITLAIRFQPYYADAAAYAMMLPLSDMPIHLLLFDVIEPMPDIDAMPCHYLTITPPAFARHCHWLSQR